MGGHAPLGYDIVEKKLVINPAEAKSIRYIFHRYLELGGVRQLCDDLRAHGIYSKVHDSNIRPGGMPFSRGALYRLLSNPLYAGQIRYKGICYRGQHESIIEPELWDQAQQTLVNNRVGTIKPSRRTEAESLSGKLFDAATGEALVITHANKKGRRYRYYISQSLKTGIEENALGGWRLPGRAIETAVYSIAQSMLKDRDAIVDAVQAACVPRHHIPAFLAKAQDAAQHPALVFDKLLSRIELRHDGVQVQLALASLVSTEAGGNDICMTRNTPMQIKRRGHEMRLVVEGGVAATASIDSTLVNSIARAHAWSDALLSGAISSMAEIAARNNVSDSYVKKIMPLAFLAPDIVAAIMAGKQPAHLTTHMLVRQTTIPLDWQEQRRLLGFSA